MGEERGLACLRVGLEDEVAGVGVNEAELGLYSKHC